MIDYQIHLSDLVVFFGGLIAFFKIFLTTRDLLREFGHDIEGLRGDVDRIDGVQAAHHEWLVRNGLDRRSYMVGRQENMAKGADQP